MAPFCSCPASLVSRIFFAVGPGCAKCFFLLRSVGRRDLSAGPEQQKNTTQGVFFCSGPGERQGKEKPRAGASKKTPWVVIFFCCGPPRTRPGWCCFFCCGPARTLTHSLWAGAISARPGWFFLFLLRPRRVFLDNNKKCLGYYIGSKKTRRGHSKKKHHFLFAEFTSPPKLYTFSLTVGNIIPKCKVYTLSY